MGETVRVEPAVLEKLKGYPWPGNVRELANGIQHMMVFCRGNLISLEDLPPYLTPGEAADSESAPGKIQLMKMVSELERKWILAKLKESNWNKEKAAQQLGLTRKMLMNRMAKHKIKAPQEPRPRA
jgi:DNA-binding NtrC family response regulator